MFENSSNRLYRLQYIVAAAAAVLVVAAFASWGGLPAPDQQTRFWIGVVVLLAVLGALGLLAWHLLIRPAGQPAAARPVPARTRQLMAVLLAAASVNIIAGGFWDEVWHRLYGLPFGEDFFWRPHLLMYFGFLCVIGLAFAGLTIISRGRGTFQQRFRANPALGWLVLMGLFLMFALPADPIWHGIYGEDLTAWSIPHLLLGVCFGSIMLLASALHLSALPQRAWRGLRRFSWHDLLPLLMAAGILLIMLQLFTTEWDQPDVMSSPIMQARPEWVFPAFILGMAAIAGMLANHSLRLVGGATLVGLIALGARVGMIAAFDTPIMRFNGWLLAIPPLVALDAWQAYRLWGARGAPGWIGSGLTAALGMALVSVGVLLPRLYPFLAISSLPALVIALALAGLAGSWLGTRLGEAISAKGEPVAEEAAAPARVRLISLSALVAVVAFILVFIQTATPPV